MTRASWIRSARELDSEVIDDLRHDYRSRFVSRREFVRRASAAGLTVAGASALLVACGEDSGAGGGGDDPLKIGALIPITGVFAVLAHQMKNNAVLAVDELNEMGGIKGRKVELIIEDAASDPDDAGIHGADRARRTGAGRVPRPRGRAPSVLDLRDVVVHRGRAPVVHGVSFEVGAGESVCLLAQTSRERPHCCARSWG